MTELPPPSDEPADTRERISLLVPVFNEEETLPLFWEEIRRSLFPLDFSWEVVFVEDGSSDQTWARLAELTERAGEENDVAVRCLRLSRNFGKEAALTAGLLHCSGDAIIPLDVDLQDPISLIPEMLQKWREGFDVVLAERASRATDSFLKRTTANLFYSIHRKISDVDLPPNVGDFRLMSRRVVDSLNRLEENQRFMKGIFAWVGYPTARVTYERPARSAGESKFNFWKLWNFGIEGITSFSTFPLRVFLYIGAAVSLGSFFYAAYIVVKTLIFGIDVPGYASILTFILFFGGMNLTALGIIGEYLGRIYYESKQRPVFIVSDRLDSSTQPTRDEPPETRRAT